jgi:glutamate-1-semialdehyde 2,1-aminomutase
MAGPKSQSLFERGQKVLVEGVSSASRGPATFGGAPRYMSHGAGARLYDVDGREYIDWMMAFGALPLGHAHPKVVETIAREAARGTHFATALEVEVEVAEMLVALLPHVDKVRFANTGTEAAMAAFRLARGHTGRRKIIKFEGHYHGWWDSVLINTNPYPPPCWATRTTRSAFPTRRVSPRRRGRTPSSCAGTTLTRWSGRWRCMAIRRPAW